MILVFPFYPGVKDLGRLNKIKVISVRFCSETVRGLLTSDKSDAYDISLSYHRCRHVTHFARSRKSASDQMQPLPSGYPQQGVVTYPQPQYVQGVQPVAGQTIIIQTNYPSRGSRVHDSYPAKASKVFGLTQLTIGILLVILNIVAIAIDAYLAEVGHGFWCGLFVSTECCR